MGEYYYHYINNKGRRDRAILEAHSLQEAKDILRSRGILVLSCVRHAARLGTMLKKRKSCALRGQVLITFTTQLSQLLNAGMPLYEALVTLEEQYRTEPFRPLLESVCAQIKGGAPLSEALARFPKSFSSLYCALIAAGEAVGDLQGALEKLVDLLRRQYRLKKQLIAALLYPAVLCIFSLIVITILLVFVVPTLIPLFQEGHVNRFTSCVLGLSLFITQQWIYYLPLLGACTLALIAGCKKKWLHLYWERFALKIPLINTLIVATSLARFTRTMGSLLDGGANIIQALRVARAVMGHKALEAIVLHAEEKIIGGSLLSQELKRSPLIPPLVPRMLAIGEESGALAQMLHKIADLYEEEVEKHLQRLTTLAQPLILIVMGALVGLIMLAVLLPLTDINSFL